MATDREIAEVLSGGGSVYCGKCLQECNVEGRDYGIGTYGYGAGMGSHSDVCLESTCCDSEDLLLKSELPEEEGDEEAMDDGSEA
jgi:hypothetical protein